MRNWRKYWESSSESESEIEADGYTEQGKPLTRGQIESIQSDIRDKLELKPADRLLEVGCGVGLQLKFLSGRTGNLVGTDYALGMLKQASCTLPGALFFVSEAAFLPVRKTSFDKVFCYSIFHYFPDYSYAERAISRMIEACRKGGIVLIGDVQDLDRKNEYLKYLGEYTRNLTPWQRLRLTIHRAKNRLLGRREKCDVDETFFKRDFFKDYIGKAHPGCSVEILDQVNVRRITAQRRLRYDVLIRT
jgi:ubiquinone/menaquinone biosynthesis C-methylase UbiE